MALAKIPHKLEESHDRKQFLKELENIETPWELEGVTLDFLFKPCKTKDKKGHYDQISFRQHPSIVLILEELISEFSKECDLNMSDANRAGQIGLIWILMKAIKNRKISERSRKSLNALVEIERVLNAKGLQDRAKDLKLQVTNADFPNDETARLITIINIAEENLGIVKKKK